MLIKPGIKRQTPIVHPKPVFRARPNTEQQEEVTEYQKEEVFGEEQYWECEWEEAQGGHMHLPRIMSLIRSVISVVDPMMPPR